MRWHKGADRVTVQFRKKSEPLLENDNYLTHFMQFYVTHLWCLGGLQVAKSSFIHSFHCKGSLLMLSSVQLHLLACSLWVKELHL